MRIRQDPDSQISKIIHTKLTARYSGEETEIQKDEEPFHRSF